MKKLQKGFTLVEALVSIAIIGIVSSLALGNYNTARQLSQNEIDADVVIGSLRAAQIESLAPDKQKLGVRESDFVCAIGVEIGSQAVSSRVISGSTCNPLPSQSREYNRATLAQGATILRDNAQGSSGNSVAAVYFRTPFGNIDNSRSSFEGTDNVVELVVSRGKASQTIFLYNSGIIER